jgi:hypothetical protein
MVLFINRANPLMQVVHTITMVQQAEQEMLHMVVVLVMMPATIGVRVEEEARVVMDKAALQEAPVVLALVTILEPAVIRLTDKVAMVVAMETVQFPDLREQLIPVTAGMEALIQPETAMLQEAREEVVSWLLDMQVLQLLPQVEQSPPILQEEQPTKCIPLHLVEPLDIQQSLHLNHQQLRRTYVKMELQQRFL